MISDTILLLVIFCMLIHVLGSRLIPQLVIFSLIVYNVYNMVIISFEPLDVIMFAIVIIYCLSHAEESINLKEET